MLTAVILICPVPCSALVEGGGRALFATLLTMPGTVESGVGVGARFGLGFEVGKERAGASMRIDKTMQRLVDAMMI
jgi:hypothetical protein